MTGQVQIPARFRAWVYGIYTVLGIGLAGSQVGFSSAETHEPLWLKVSLSIYVFLGPAIGFTAASHTPAAPDAAVAPVVVPPAPPEV